MRLTSLLLFAPVVLAAPIPAIFFGNAPGTGLSGLKSTTQAVAGDVAAFEKASTSSIVTIKSASKDLAAVITQAGDTKNNAVITGAKDARTSVEAALKAAQSIADAVKNKATLLRNDQAIVAKGVTTAQSLTSKLEAAITNKNSHLSMFIASAVADLGLARKDVDAILAFSNLTVENVGEPLEGAQAEAQAKLQQGRDNVADGLKGAITDLASVVSQADKTKNAAVSTGAKAAQAGIATAQGAVGKIITAIQTNVKPDRNDQAIVAKGIVTAQAAVGGLEKAIVTKDADLSKFIAASIADVALTRKGAEAVLAFNNLTFDTIGEPKGEDNKGTKNAGDKTAAAGDVAAIEKASVSSVTDLKSTSKDFAAVVAQAEDTKNDAVVTSARELRVGIQTALKAAQSIADAVKNKSTLLRNDQAILAKGVTTAQTLAGKLEAAIKNKDEFLSSFIASGIEDLGLLRKDVDAILAFSNLTVDNVGEPVEGDQADALAKLQQGRDNVADGLKGSTTDLASVVSQADKTKNTAVSTGAKAAQAGIATAQGAVSKIITAIQTNVKPDRNDQAIVAKGIVTAQAAVGGLEKAIVTKDADLSKFIAAAVADVALTRKGAEAVLAFSNLTFDTIGEPKGTEATKTELPSATATDSESPSATEQVAETAPEEDLE